jgi:DNA replication protein DnaT
MNFLISKNINLNLFCKHPIQIIEKENNSILSVSKNKKILFYVITPEILEKLFDIKKCDLKNIIIKKEKKVIEKFPMHSNWMPDKDFIRKAALWGIYLNEEVSKHELSSFISYWKAEGLFFHHIQWEQKLARSLERSRSINNLRKKRDITYIPIPDQETPDGFRGK